MRGFTVFLTGLPASGKSTLATALYGRLVNLATVPRWPVTVLDGDFIRQQVAPGLGYSREDRDAQVQRVGRMAADVTRTGGVAICSVIAPYDRARQQARALIEPVGRFVLVYLSTPLETCEARDPKGLYARARAGLIDHFTGLSDPYEPPSDADLVIDTTAITPEESVKQILDYLESARVI